MTERELVEQTATPVTVQTLRADLAALGVGSGQTLLLHSSLSSLGWVCGGAPAVVVALLGALGTDGTLVVPTHSSDLSDPADWHHPPVPAAWHQTIREQLPAYQAAITPSRGMGAIPELVRTLPGSVRSDHPQVSFAAVGRRAREITSGHGLAYGLGERSPLARLYDAGAQVLLLGVGHDRNTSLHLAEYRAGVRPPLRQAGPVLVEGHRHWAQWDDIDLDEEGFPAVGAAFEQERGLRPGRVGSAEARLLPQRGLVDFATEWFRGKTTDTARGNLEPCD